MWPSVFGTVWNVRLLCCQATDETSDVRMLNEKLNRLLSTGLCQSDAYTIRSISLMASDDRKGRHKFLFYFWQQILTGMGPGLEGRNPAGFSDLPGSQPSHLGSYLPWGKQVSAREDGKPCWVAALEAWDATPTAAPLALTIRACLHHTEKRPNALIYMDYLLFNHTLSAWWIVQLLFGNFPNATYHVYKVTKGVK